MEHPLSWVATRSWMGALFTRERRACVPRPLTPLPTRADAAFVERVHAIVEAELGNSAFGVEWLADAMCLCPRQLQRRLRRAAGTSAAAFIREMRLARAAQLLRESDRSIAGVALSVGYRDVRHFSRRFREMYGVPPSAYARRFDRPGEPADVRTIALVAATA